MTGRGPAKDGESQERQRDEFALPFHVPWGWDNEFDEMDREPGTPRGKGLG
jgi:hypothetical protein